MMGRTAINRAERPLATRVLLLAAFVAPLLWIFGEAIFQSRSFVFRDAAHYYYPLFRWSAEEWSRGRPPLWSPLENGGAALAADPTASVFYPGKLVFALPLVYATRFKLYVLGHLLMAGAAAYFVARRWNASVPAAAAAGVSYAFSGSIAFQYCNVVYLVGAAWLPLAIWCGDGLLRRRRWPWAAGMGAVLAMMILGGDPQTAYHAGLIAVLGAWLRRRPAPVARIRDIRSWGFPRTMRQAARHRLVLLGGAALVTFLLAAVQIVPAAGWTQRSDRALYSAPRTVYEVPSWLARGEEAQASEIAAGLLGRPQSGTHHAHLYEFSVGPWRWAEFVWPNFSGRMFPVHRRWIAAIPAEGRVWTPSLYFGLAPLAAAVAAMRLRGGSFRTRWLTWTALLAIAAALGWYGAGWLWHEVRFAVTGVEPSEGDIGAPTGGLYWLLVQAIPGYVYFRYPAKWLTVASIALSLLAARGWDVAFTGRSLRARRLLIAIIALSLVGVAGWAAMRPYWSDWLASVPPDDFLGPLDADGAARDLLLAFVRSAVVASTLLLLMRAGNQGGWGGAERRPSTARGTGASIRSAPTTYRSAPATRTVLAVLVTSLDLALAHGWLAPTAPQEIWEGVPAAAKVIADDAESSRPPGFRVFRGSQSRWAPERWQTISSPARHVEGLVWDHASLYPKYHLAPELPLVETYGALASADYRAFLHIARRRGFVRPDGVVEPAPEALRLLGARYLVLPHDAAYPHGERIVLFLGAGDLTNVAVWRDSAPLPRAWIVHRVVPMPPLTDRSPAALLRRTREVMLPRGRWRDFTREAVVEIAGDLAIPQPSLPAPEASAEIVRLGPGRIEIEFETASPGLLVLSDLYDADWQAYVLTGGNEPARPAPVLRTNRILRGLWLPAGRGRVVFVYRPAGLYAGAAVSAVAWIFFALVIIMRGLLATGRRGRTL